MAEFCRIRPATPDDLGFIRAQEDDPDNIYVHAYDDARHLANLKDQAYRYFISEDENGEPLGFAILIENKPDRIEWRRIIVDTDCRGTGKPFMRAVLKAMFEGAGAETVWLDVYEQNARARHVYRSLGFVETGEDTQSVPGTRLILMECTRGTLTR